MKLIFILLLALYLQADECIKCEEAIDDMIEAIEVNDKDKALELTDEIIKECYTCKHLEAPCGDCNTETNFLWEAKDE